MNYSASLQAQFHAAPEWVIITPVPSEIIAAQLTASYYQPWGHSPTVACYQLRPRHSSNLYFDSTAIFATTLRSHIQHDMDISYTEAGPRAFKPGTTEADFHGCELYAVKARPYHLLQPLHMRPLSTWPTPPSTAPPSPAFHPKDTDADRLIDRQRWLTQGANPWETSLLPEHVAAFRAHLREYRVDADRLANAATAAGRGNTAHLKWLSPHVLSIEQTMLRPGAQGSFFEITTTGTSETPRLPVTSDLLYNVPHIVAAAADLHFPDQEAIYELTVGGASLGNPGMPLTTHICRNHQGAAKHWHAVTDQLRVRIESGELRGPNPAAADDTRYDGFASPPSIPAIAVPINGTESRLKEHDYLLKRAGLPFQMKIRPTFDLSSPHDLECSPNDLCFIDPSTQTPWTTADQVADDVLTLSAACPDLNHLRGFKVDLHAAYRQLHAKRTDRWQQQIFWRFPVNGVMRGGWFEDTRMMWGGKRAGILFHRAVTSLVVLFIQKRLQTVWMDTISSLTTRKWITSRRAGGYRDEQLLPAIVKGFLDDFFFIIAGSPEDQAGARSIILDALHHLGFALSESKLLSDGTLSSRIDILGHVFDLKTMTRGVAPYKQKRATDSITDLLNSRTWPLETLQSLLGLLQSVKRSVPRRWPLAPAYAVLHSQGPDPPAKTALRPSSLAKTILQRVIATITLPKSLYTVTIPWPTPTDAFALFQPESDASKHYGFGAILRDTDTTSLYTRGPWPTPPSAGTNIDLLEAIAVLITGTTFGTYFKGRRIAFRSDSSPATFALNTLKSGRQEMRTIAIAWEAIQDHFDFEAMIFHIPGIRNVFSDACSRDPDPHTLASTLQREADKLGHRDMQWTFNPPILHLPLATPPINIHQLIQSVLLPPCPRRAAST